MFNNYPGVSIQNYSDYGLSDVFATILRRVYLWMALGLFVTAGTAAFVSVSPLFQALVGQPLLFFVLMIAVIVLVIGLSWGINRLAPATAILLFILYIALNGVTFSVRGLYIG
jgi:FtsH-binding integral membrane protein